jgi:uncharacterized protein (TIGR03067 family)
MNHLFLSLILVCADGGDRSAVETATVADDLPKLGRGEWQVIGAVSGSQDYEGVQGRMKFGGNKLTFQTGSVEYHYTVRLNPNARLKQMDWAQLGNGSPIKGLYQLDGDSLKIALSHTTDRPIDLSGNGRTRVYILKRISP